MTAILKDDVPELPAAGASCRAGSSGIVRRCLEKNEEERLQSARDVAIALEAVSGSEARPASFRYSCGEAGRAAVAAGLLLAALSPAGSLRGAC